MRQTWEHPYFVGLYQANSGMVRFGWNCGLGKRVINENDKQQSNSSNTKKQDVGSRLSEVKK